MASDLSVDSKLMDEALKVGGLKSKKDTINLALEEFIKRRKTTEILTLFGQIDYDADYNYKESRRRG